MSQQHEFKTYDAYVDAQLKLTRGKIKTGRGNRCFASEKVLTTIHRHHQTPVEFGVCHGVRKGQELAMFEAGWPDAKWVGTEIVPELCDGERILNLDFADAQDEWIDSVDLIYTNSFDHSWHPRDVAAAWISCLRPVTGRLYVEWTPWHIKLGKYGNKADCFAASQEEYLEILDDVGSVHRVLRVRDRSKKDNRRYTRSIFVAGR